MYDQIREDTIYMMLYAVVAMLSLIASCYLLFRHGQRRYPDGHMAEWLSLIMYALLIWYFVRSVMKRKD